MFALIDLSNCKTYLLDNPQVLKLNMKSIKQLPYKMLISDQHLLPKGCVYTSTNKSGCFFVIEQQPQVRSVRIGDRFYRLAFPYVIFIIESPSGYARIFFRNEPLQSLFDMLYAPCLPNIHNGDCDICYNGPSYKSCSSHREFVEKVISSIWSSSFNYDLTSYVQYYKRNEPYLSSFESWENASRIDPYFILDVKFLANKELIHYISKLWYPTIVNSFDLVYLSDVKVTNGIASVGDIVEIRGLEGKYEIDNIISSTRKLQVFVHGLIEGIDPDKLTLVQDRKEELSSITINGREVKVGDFCYVTRPRNYSVEKVRKILKKDGDVFILLKSGWTLVYLKGKQVTEIFFEGDDIKEISGVIKIGDKVSLPFRSELKSVETIRIENKQIFLHLNDGTKEGLEKVDICSNVEPVDVDAFIDRSRRYYKVGLNAKSIVSNIEILAEMLPLGDRGHLKDLIVDKQLKDGICNFSVGDKVLFVNDGRFGKILTIDYVKDPDRGVSSIVLNIQVGDQVMSTTLLYRSGNDFFYNATSFVKVVDSIVYDGFTLRSGMDIAMRASCRVRIPNFRKTETFKIVGFVPKGFRHCPHDIMLVDNRSPIWMVPENMSLFQFTDGKNTFQDDRTFPKPADTLRRGRQYLTVMDSLLIPVLKKSDSIYSFRTVTYLDSYLAIVYR